METLDSSEPSSGASVPYLGCYAFMKNLLLFIALTTFASGAVASARVITEWDSIIIKSGRATIDLQVDRERSHLEHVTLELYGKIAAVPENKLKNLPLIRFQTLELVWGCGGAVLRHPELGEEAVYCQNVSMEFDDGPENAPAWYENPRVTFVFSDGKFIERTITRKISESTWETSAK